jgi:RNA polymerase sigma factor (sigma-70 family)
MTEGPLKGLGLHLRRAVGPPDLEAATDGQLLDGFLTGRDEAAFAALVRRHGRMVLAVCRRVLGHAHDAEDAFQATFLVLARKGRGLTGRATLGGWLHQAASLAARKARQGAQRRRAREAAAARPAEAAPTPDEPEWLPVLHQELNRLAEKYRVPLVLCDLEGRRRQEVAGQLGIPEGTLSSRLATGRKKLIDRLGRRGVTAPAGALAAAGLAADAVPAALAEATLRAAAVAAGHAVGTVPAAVAQLVTGVSRAMFLTNARLGLLVLPAALLLGSAGVFAFARPADRAAGPPAARAPGRPTPPVKPPAAPVPAVGEPDLARSVGPPTPGEPAGRAEFRKEYGLAARQALKLVPGPFPDWRKACLPVRLDEQTLARFSSDGRRITLQSMTAGAYGWPEKERGPKGAEKPPRGMRLWELLESALHVAPPLLEGDDSLLLAEVYADVVVREGAPWGPVAKALQAELRDKCGLTARVVAREEEREVLVARGKYTHKPRAGRLNGVVDLSARPLPEDDNAVGGTYGSYGGGPEAFFRRLGEHVGRAVFDETVQTSWKLERVGGKDSEAWRGYMGCRFPRRSRTDIRPPDASAERDAVLKHVAEQTGLAFKSEKRKVWVLSVRKAEK